MSKINTLLLQNQNVLKRIPMGMSWASRFLISRDPLRISDLHIKTRFSNSYALLSDKKTEYFRMIRKKIDCYLGTGPVGLNKMWEYPWVLANLRLKKGMSILDAGCGKSPLQFLLCEVGCEVTGIDVFENVEWHGIDRRLSKRFRCPIEYRRESIDSLSFTDNTYDRVCCVSVIEHCKAKGNKNGKMTPFTEEDRQLHRKMIGEMIRVLKPGGFLVITVDFNFPRDNCLLESNVDVANLISIEEADLYGEKCNESFPGDKGFDPFCLINNSDIEIINYYDTLQTSIGFTLKKKEKS